MSDSQRPDPHLRLLLPFDAALHNYEKQTGFKLIDHPLARELENCHTVHSVMDILQHQARAFTGFLGDDGKIMRSLERGVHVLHELSMITTLGEGIDKVYFPSAKPIFTAFGILLAAIKGSNSSYDALINLLETIEHFLGRLGIHINRFKRSEPPKPPIWAITPDMGKIIVKIMVELLSTIALVTKQIKQSRPWKIVNKILGENEVESALQRLDRLTFKEAHATATQTLAVVHGLAQHMRIVVDDGKASADMIWDALKIMQEALDLMNEALHRDLQGGARRWLSPPDLQKNHITTRESHYKGTSRWFIEGNTFAKWKSSGPDSLLWIHGKPGAGKSVICSIIIEDVLEIRKRGLASLAFFYCDFRDVNKKNLRGLVSSLLLQLFDHSGSYATVFSKFYSAHGDGSREPSDGELIECLKNMLKRPGQAPVYIIIDGLDECSDTSGMPSPREKVLVFLESLVDLHLQSLHICITSRPEVDIKTTIDRLPFQTVSLHDESGQRQDIFNYVRSIVYTDAKMERWRLEDKELVVDVLTRKADGMFHWVFCQLEFLRRCRHPHIQQALEELPESLDGTYERTLRDINKANWKLAHRIFQCVAVSFRPLRVEELAEFLALDFKAGPTPTLRPRWRPADPLDAVLSTCSSLLAVVKDRDYEFIQFSHFSVKEFLMSTRLASAGDTISCYCVSITSAHTLVAQACLGLLLHLRETTPSDILKNFPLAEYAAEHWADHARHENVSEGMQDAMKHLFDPRTRRYQVLLGLFDPLRSWNRHYQPTHPTELKTSRLHYTAFYGFHSLTAFLVIECSQNVNETSFGVNQTPLHTSSRRGHVTIIQTLVDIGADVNFQDQYKSTPLHVALKGGHVETARVLVDNGADVNAQDQYKSSPLHVALKGGHVEFARVLVELGADVNVLDIHKSSPLHVALMGGHMEFAYKLVELGADVNAQDLYKSTPLSLALQGGDLNFAGVLVECGADVNHKIDNKSTPLHFALKGKHMEFALRLIKHGADVNAEDEDGSTPLHLAFQGEHVELARVISQHASTRDSSESTPLHLALKVGQMEFARMLVHHGADVNSRDICKSTPLHLALKGRRIKFAGMLIKHGADVNSQDNYKSSPLHLAVKGRLVEFARLLVEHGADVNSKDNHKSTPLHLAVYGGHVEFARVLVGHGADVNSRDIRESIPLHLASQSGHVVFARLLIELGADVNAQDRDTLTPLHLSLRAGHVEFARVLIEQGADVNARDRRSMSTPLHLASRGKHVAITQMLVEHGADVNARDRDMLTPLHLVSQGGHVGFARVLVELGADVNAQGDDKSAPLHLALKGGHMEFARMLVDRGADVNSRDRDMVTPLHLASKSGHVEFAQLLVHNGADVNTQNGDNLAPLLLALEARHVELGQVLVDHGADVNSKGDGKLTLLLLALKGGQMEFARILVENGADVNVQDDDNSTPLHLALEGGHVEFSHMLIGHAADVNSPDKCKLTPLHLSLKGGHVEFAQKLVEHGADLNAPDDDKSTPLHLALMGKHVEFAQVLIENGAEVNAEDKDGTTPLNLAFQGGHVELARVLVEYAKPRNSDKSTPLHLALKGGHVEFARALVNHGADVNSRKISKSTPLHIASKGGHIEFARMLIEHGADVNSCDNYKSTPLHLALRGKHVAFARMLIEHGADVNSRDNFRSTSLHLASRGQFQGVMQLLLEHGAVRNGT